jgi:hypothetical protein
MLKCPFCGFANEDGALFCEQCKSDLGAVTPAPSAAADVPVAEVIEPAEVAEVVEATPAAPEGLTPASAAAEVATPVPEPVPAQAEAPSIEPAAGAAAAAAAAAAKPSAPAAKGASVPAGAKPKLVVKRGQKVGYEFPIYPEDNYVGRADEKPVDIDLEDQEPPERVWCSRQHALIHFDENAGTITLEDLNSSNGTYVNRERVYPGQPRQLFVNDTIQIGTVHLTLKV